VGKKPDEGVLRKIVEMVWTCNAHRQRQMDEQNKRRGQPRKLWKENILQAMISRRMET
jgi:hypothetical protein